MWPYISYTYQYHLLGFSSANGRERQLGCGVPWQSGNATETGKEVCMHAYM